MKYELPGAAVKPNRSKAAAGVMNDKNAQRLVDIINEAKKNPDLYHGMAGWYVMDPLFKKVVDTVGRKAAPAAYSRLNSFMGMASPGSDVNTEIARGTAAHMMDTQGRFGEFLSQGGRPEGSKGKPPELAAVPGTPVPLDRSRDPDEPVLADRLSADEEPEGSDLHRRLRSPGDWVPEPRRGRGLALLSRARALRHAY